MQVSLYIENSFIFSDFEAMHIESSANDVYIRALNFGSYPKNVVEFQDSLDYFQQLIFIDYELQLLIQDKYNGDELPDNTSRGIDSIILLTNYIDRVSLNYSENSKSYEEKLYYTTLKAHLLFFAGELDEMRRVLNLISLSTEVNLSTTSVYQVEFIQYLTCRYYVLLGLTNHKVWIDYLNTVPQSFTKSQVSAKYWLTILYFELGSSLAAKSLIHFKDLTNLKFFSNRISAIGFSSYLLLHTKLVDANFAADFAAFINEEIEGHLTDLQKFPHADESNVELDDYISNLYESVEQFNQPFGPPKLRILKASSSKRLLINATSKTFQSQNVLTNLVYTLIYNHEYDEAFAAFDTLTSYIKNEQDHNGGNVANILSIISIYSTCLYKFNLIHSAKKFKYTAKHLILKKLKLYSENLLEYLKIFGGFVGLAYDEKKHDDLSFLYEKFNPHILSSETSELVETISLAWYSLGYYYYHLSTDESSSAEVLEGNVTRSIQYYHNSLVVNPAGNEKFLFSYALTLANTQKLKPALKLSKFILKKFPESFKTWNLLVLLVTAFEANNPGDSKESEKFIENALNIAGLYISKNRKRLLVEAKYEILQLKLTQLAVWESIYGTSYILEFVGEVFILFHELFDFEQSKGSDVLDSTKGLKDNKWSHRPSFLDANAQPTNYEPETFSSPAEEESVEGRPKEKLLRRLSRVASHGGRSITSAVSKIVERPEAQVAKGRYVGQPPSSTPTKIAGFKPEKRILQEIWLWAAKIYIQVGLLEDAEQCIVEAETVHEPNVRTFNALGYLTASDRKHLSLQEFERALEILTHDEDHSFTKTDYGNTILGLSKLFFLNEPESSLFISEKDKEAGIIRLKNLLEKHTLSWPYGSNNSEIWFYLSKIYEIIDDKPLLTQSLWRCVELEDFRPVRSFISICSATDI